MYTETIPSLCEYSGWLPYCRCGWEEYLELVGLVSDVGVGVGCIE